MKLEWMGRYRELVRALVFYSNSSTHGASLPSKRDDGFNLNQHEYQILEYICEFEDDNRILADISRDTGILRSSVTKSTQHLVSLKLVERFQTENNRKNIILKPTALGKEVYELYRRRVEPVFPSFFKMMERFSDEELTTFENAVRILGGDWGDLTKEKLKKIDQN